MDTFYLQLLAEDRAFYQGECRSMTVPTTDGSMGILAHHSSMAAALVPGKLTYHIPGEEPHTVAVSRGLVKVEKNRVLVLARSMERVEDIDVERALRAARSARSVPKHDTWEYHAAQAALARAENRLRLKGITEYD